MYWSIAPVHEKIQHFMLRMFFTVLLQLQIENSDLKENGANLEILYFHMLTNCLYTFICLQIVCDGFRTTPPPLNQLLYRVFYMI